MAEKIVIFGGLGKNGSDLACVYASKGYEVVLVDTTDKIKAKNLNATGNFELKSTFIETDNGQISGLIKNTNIISYDKLVKNPDFIKDASLIYSFAPSYVENTPNYRKVLAKVAENNNTYAIVCANGIKFINEDEKPNSRIIPAVSEYPSTGGKINVSKETFTSTAIRITSEHGIEDHTFNKIKEIHENAGVGFNYNQPTKQMILNKLPAILSMASMALFDEKFGAVNEQGGYTNILTKGLLKEVYTLNSLAMSELRTFDQFYNAQCQVFEKKKGGAGSLPENIRAGERTEAKEIFESLAYYGNSLEGLKGEEFKQLHQAYKLANLLERQSILDHESSPPKNGLGILKNLIISNLIKEIGKQAEKEGVGLPSQVGLGVNFTKEFTDELIQKSFLNLDFKEYELIKNPPKNCIFAAVNIDMQGHFTEKGAALCVAGAETTKGEIANLLTYSIANNIPTFNVIREHTVSAAKDQYCNPGSEGSKIAAEHDIRGVVNIVKKRFSAFHGNDPERTYIGTNMFQKLKNLGVSKPLIMGTQVGDGSDKDFGLKCLDSTIIDAAKYGFSKVILVEGTYSARNPETLERGLAHCTEEAKKINPNFEVQKMTMKEFKKYSKEVSLSSVGGVIKRH